MVQLNDKFYTTKDLRMSECVNVNYEDELVLLTDPNLKKWLLINSGMCEIIKKCDGNTTVSEIISKLKKQYPNNYNEEMSKNIIQVLNSLYNENLIFKSKKECDEHITHENKDKFNSLYIEITSKCNLKCRHCFGEFQNNSFNEISKDKIFNILSEAKNLGAENIVLSGGEPLLHKDFIEICTNALEMDFTTIISTNGLLINEKILSLFNNSPKLKIQFSLEGINKETHEALRGKCSFKPTINAIKLLIDNGFADRISISTTIFKQNVQEIESIVQWCIKNKIKKISFKKLFREGRADLNWSDLIISNDDNEIIEYFTNTLNSILEKYEDKISITGYPSEKSFKLNSLINLKYPCPLGASIRIDSIGNVYPCQLLNTKEFIIGNIYKSSLEKVLNSDELENLFDLARSRMKKISKCSNCKFLHFCGGGCMAQSLLDYNTVYSEYTYCNFRHSVLNKKLRQSLVSDS
ncbi:radical SAM/SPASM domain-containing protein [Clostridium sp. KNHs214]|uniref:radical SAM/SPASM domain-containing protein n=1 Tax=Clostridium sp. KNHs214 TaxID=1540257 RepID=UPI000555A221|nr:radical SAM/SPASM domain-containing protein [Clostridium sp. KNHs214]